MSGDCFWMGRMRHKESGAYCCLRVEDGSCLPSEHSKADRIADPFAQSFAGSKSDAVERARAAPAIESRRLGEYSPEFVPALPLRPGKMIGIGRNFSAHARELNNEVPTQPLLFFKPSSALLLDGEPLELPRGIGRVDMEAELVVVIVKEGRNISIQDAKAHVGGLLMGNDISARALQKAHPRWVRAKGADGFAPLARWIRMERGLPPQTLRVQGFVDDRQVQDAPISQFVFDLPTLIADISSTMRLEAGDLIFTGTPAGVCELSVGQCTRVEAEGLLLAGVRTPVI